MSTTTIKDAIDSGHLVVVFGAGVSIALTETQKSALSWGDLVKDGVRSIHERALIKDGQKDRQIEAINSGDTDELIGVAEFVGRKLGAPAGAEYGLWLRSVFGRWKPDPGPMQNVIRAIARSGVPIATLNFDDLVEQCTGLTSIECSDKAAALSWIRKEKPCVLHLHGIWSKPEGCVFGIRDYHSAAMNEFRSFVQHSLGGSRNLLFIGCGDTLEDPNFSCLVAWLRGNIGAGMPLHYALVREVERRDRLADSSWRGFVEPVSFGSQYSDLPNFLDECFTARKKSNGHTRRQAKNQRAIRDTKTIEDYCRFIQKDCGKMTIEGLRADMDTAQRKFNLEELFVPLRVTQLPPTISPGDPDKDEKLKAWKERENKSIPFGKTFETKKKVALLALPGGGKTLLLKRLAAAYTMKDRIGASSDELPDINVIPIMIRCREWKEFITKPIQIMLTKIASITGEPSISGLYGAIESKLRSGDVLILVDGLDEIHDDASREIFTGNLERFIEQFPKIRLIVTSREAGFELVAPCLARFCDRYRIAPLDESAIHLLCAYWHKLMIGETSAANLEGEEVARTLINSPALRRLAENPLLLTMLLVVKHGNGRLPPDRVRLYERAVDVLLDTWNIKGHAALNAKEAGPQLACLAYEMLLRGKQTATEADIVDILERARRELPNIGLYAKDNPRAFLKRVELRSSLLLEAGNVEEAGKVVPFYQFRHLTFQEYLAAVAVVDGHTLSKQGKSTLEALKANLLSEEWKEVIPMAAVLAKSQAGPLIDALILSAENEKKEFLGNLGTIAFQDAMWKLPPAASRLLQAMIEEATFSSQSLERAANVIAFLASGCLSQDNWRALCRGPFGPQARAAAVSAFIMSRLGPQGNLRETAAAMEAFAVHEDFWSQKDWEESLVSRIETPDEREKVAAILSVGGGYWTKRERIKTLNSKRIYEALEEHMFDSRRPVRYAAAWSWGFWRNRNRGTRGRPVPQERTLITLASSFFSDKESDSMMFWFVASELDGVARGACRLELRDEHKAELDQILSDFSSGIRPQGREERARVKAGVRWAYLIDGAYSDSELRSALSSRGESDRFYNDFKDIYAYLGLGRAPKKSHPPIGKEVRPEAV